MKSKTINEFSPRRKQVKRKGIHAKTKSSSHKGSKLYKKTYKGQGR